jgi:uncharacterized protein (TIGR03435 family)
MRHMRRMLMAAMTLMIVALTARANAQDLPAFVVSSIKSNASGVPYRQSRDRTDGLAIVNEPLRDIITFAFDLYDFQLAGAPDWASNDRFDITARADATLSIDEKRARLQRLLADRFALRVHVETRAQATYVLVKAPGRGGAGLTPRDCAEPGIAHLPCGGGSASPDGGVMRLAGVPIARLTSFVGGVIGRVVTDETGRSGVFDIDWQWRPDIGVSPELSDEAKLRIAARPSLPVALREQLGLALEARRAPVRFVVIEHVSRPTPD